MLKLTRKELQDFDSALAREWLETNGLGGYASSTVLGINTRKYHGLLVAAVNPPVDRLLMVSRVDEALIIDGARFEVSASEYQDIIHPDGFRYLDEVRLDPFPTFAYVVGGVRLRKTVFMVHGENTTCIRYSAECLSGGPRQDQVRLEVRPLLAFRDHHLLTHENPEFDRSVQREPGAIRIRPYVHMPPLGVFFGAGTFEESACWYRRYRYRVEEERGYPTDEDLYSPGRIVFEFRDKRCRSVLLTANDSGYPDPEACHIKELERRIRVTSNPRLEHRLGKALLAAADQFVVSRGPSGRAIIAGYPWFTDWGRDTMISLPGLTLAAQRFEDAKRILATYVASMHQGLVPNLFPDFSGKAEYNTIDATLWLFEAVRKYLDYTGDMDFVASILPALRDSVRYYIEGTLYSIRAGTDGLLSGGAPGVQLTWMDAKVGDKVITPRAGKPVEINALWFNALRIMADFASDFGGLAEEQSYESYASRVAEAFNRTFWNAEKSCLYDCIGSEGKDDSVRPNQILALSLTYPVLDPSKWKQVVEVVERELLTPYGLRTLSPNDPRYRGKYRGDLEARDSAYHQGTVWPWLLGHYVKAYLRAHGRNRESLDYCKRLIDPFAHHLREAGLGSISEIFDGDPPHSPCGCIAQAWSVAEVLRVMAEDLPGQPIEDSRQIKSALPKA